MKTFAALESCVRIESGALKFVTSWGTAVTVFVPFGIEPSGGGGIEVSAIGAGSIGVGTEGVVGVIIVDLLGVSANGTAAIEEVFKDEEADGILKTGDDGKDIFCVSHTEHEKYFVFSRICSFLSRDLLTH